MKKILRYIFLASFILEMGFPTTNKTWVFPLVGFLFTFVKKPKKRKHIEIQYKQKDNKKESEVFNQIYALNFDEFRNKKLREVNEGANIHFPVFLILFIISFFVRCYFKIITAEGFILIFGFFSLWTFDTFLNFWHNFILYKKIRKKGIKDKLSMKEEDFLPNKDLANLFYKRKKELLSALINKEDTLAMKDLYKKYY